jgi:hypothetical protein
VTINDETFTLMAGRELADQLLKTTKVSRAKTHALADAFLVCDRQRADANTIIFSLKQLLVRACDALETEGLDQTATEIRKAAGL